MHAAQQLRHLHVCPTASQHSANSFRNSIHVLLSHSSLNLIFVICMAQRITSWRSASDKACSSLFFGMNAASPPKPPAPPESFGFASPPIKKWIPAARAESTSPRSSHVPSQHRQGQVTCRVNIAKVKSRAESTSPRSSHVPCTARFLHVVMCLVKMASLDM